MSGGTIRDDDPFAGYTPVKPAIPVVDAEVPDIPQDRRYRKRKESGDLARVIGLVFVGVVSLALIGVIAVVAGGFFHERSVGEMVPELADYSDRVKPLTDIGRSIRARIGELPVVRTIPCGREREQESGCVSSIPAATSNVLLQTSRMEAAQRVADGDAFAFDPPGGGCPTAAVQEPEASRAGSRAVDPELKRFKTGDRKGRSLR